MYYINERFSKSPKKVILLRYGRFFPLKQHWKSWFTAIFNRMQIFKTIFYLKKKKNYHHKIIAVISVMIQTFKKKIIVSRITHYCSQLLFIFQEIHFLQYQIHRSYLTHDDPFFKKKKTKFQVHP